ncbi:ATP-binding protein [Streptomyces sp. NPDC055607]
MSRTAVERPPLLFPGSRGETSYSRMLPREPESAAVARHLVRGALDRWCLGELVEGAALAVTELVANSAQHARGTTIHVAVALHRTGRIRVSVVDRDREPPARRMPADDAERGRGLALVDAVATQWGVDPLPWGKRVWADFAPEART